MTEFSFCMTFPEVTRGNSGVYCIRNRYNKRMYIGSAFDFEKRWKLHRINLRAGKHHSKHLQHAWDKYGEQGFEFFQMQYCGTEDILAQEQYWLDETSKHLRYNIAVTAGSRQGMKNRPEHNEAIAAKARARWADPEFKAAVSAKLRAAPRKPHTVDSGNCRAITAFGKTLYLNQWADETGLTRETIAWRLKQGQNVEDALTRPARVFKYKAPK